MGSHESIRQEIEAILIKAFSPTSIEVIDDSAKHSGHTEAILHPKAGHFNVIMSSTKFDGLKAIERHRLVYDQLAPLMDEKIHALSLTLSGLAK